MEFTVEEGPIFISPLQRIEIEHNRTLAQLRRKQNLAIQEVQRQRLDNAEEQEEQIRKDFHHNRLQQIAIKAQNLRNAREVANTIGTGCECNRKRIERTLEQIIIHQTKVLPNSLSQIIMEYLPPGTTPAVRLSFQQLYVLKLITQGFNVFFTGKAGTGKSFVLSKLATLSNMPNSLVFTAMTGLAAINISGSTLHSFAGIGKGEGTLEDWMDRVRKNFKARSRWINCQCLVVDEVSMMSADMLERLNIIAQKVRRSQLPFGGIQLIFCGDFFQLPPVKSTRLCFQTPVWQQCFQKEHCIELSNIYRQDDDVYTTMLDEVRNGNISEANQKLLTALQRPLCHHQGIVPTVLKCTNVAVMSMNMECLHKLRKPFHSFHAKDCGQEPYLTRLQKNCNIEPTVTLCEGAQVMLVRNIQLCDKLANGSRGVIVKFKDGFPMVKFLDCDDLVYVQNAIWTISERIQVPGEHGEPRMELIEMASRTQIPLKLAWATTIHKSQGLTLNLVSADLNGIFESGQAYVALSRARNFQSMQVLNVSPRCFKTNPACVEFSKRLIQPHPSSLSQVIQSPQHHQITFGIWNRDSVIRCLNDDENYDDDINTKDNITVSNDVVRH